MPANVGLSHPTNASASATESAASPNRPKGGLIVNVLCAMVAVAFAVATSAKIYRVRLVIYLSIPPDIATSEFGASMITTGGPNADESPE